MSRRHDLRQRLASLLELPGDVLTEMARISLIGDRELLVENHRGLALYLPEQVVLVVPGGRLLVQGHELAIGAISPDQALIRGQICALQYVE